MDTNNRGKLAVVALAFIALAIFVVSNYSHSSIAPWEKSVAGDSFSAFARDDAGYSYAVDTGGVRLLAFTQDGYFRWEKQMPYTLRSLVCAPDGSLYATSYDFTESNLIARMSIERFSRDGDAQNTVYEERFAPGEMPVYNAGFLSMCLYEDALYFVEKSDSELALCRVLLIDPSAGKQVIARYPYENASKYVLTATADPSSRRTYFADKFGGVYRARESGIHDKLPYPEAPAAPGYSVPFSMVAIDGVLYVSDVGTRAIYAIQPGGYSVMRDMDELDVMTKNSLITYRMQLLNNEIALINSGFTWLMSPDGALADTPSEFLYTRSQRALNWAWWICACLLSLMIISFAALMCVRAYRRMGVEKLFTNILLIILVAVITVFIITRYTDNMDERFTMTTIDELSAMAALTAQLISGDDLAAIDSLDDYDTEAYRRIERALTPATGSGRTDRLLYSGVHATVYDEGTLHEVSWDAGVYRMLVRVLDGRVCYVYSSEDQYGAIYPWDYPYHGTEFEFAYTRGEAVSFVNVIDDTGEYTYTNVPIFDSKGAVAGILEMGIDQRAYREDMDRLMSEIAVSVVVVVLVVLLLLREILYFLQLAAARKPRRLKAPADVGAVRPLIFLAYFLDCFALIISPLFAMELYAANLGVSMEIGVALATSATFVFLGIASLLGAGLARRCGLFTPMIAGILMLITGETCAGLCANLWVFVFAKAVVGFGAGLLLNTADTFVSLQKDPGDVERGFSLISVGLNAGTNCGVIIGSAIGAMWGYRYVYAAGAIAGVLLLGYALLMFSKDNMPFPRERAGKGGISIARFLLDRNVFAYFAFMAVPYLIINAFVSYYLPIQGSAYGLSEATLSRLVFAYGMVCIYLGPPLMHALVSRLGGKYTLVVSGALIVCALARYAYSPELTALIIAVAIFAVADSFGMPAQNLYYARLNAVSRLGEGSALGVNSIVSGLAQAVSSYCFAMVLMFGAGIALMAAILLVAIILFTTLSTREARWEA